MSRFCTRDEPLISVITAVRNGARYLEETIASVITQPYGNMDYIIIDGGSTDGTVDIIRKYEHRLARWITGSDAGVYDAMNKGWELANADSYTLFLGAGDQILSLPDNLGQYGAADVVYGEVAMGKTRIFQPRSDWHLKMYNSLHHQALLVHKSQHIAPPFDIRYRTYADFDFNQRLKKNGARFAYAESFRAYALPGGISDNASFRESLAIIRKNFGLFWSCAAFIGYLGVKYLPLAKQLRPFATVKR